MKIKYNWLNHFLNFIAVILGVYLAFYINERAQINQDRSESLILMKSLVNDLTEDIRVYEEFQIPTNEQYQKDLDSLLNSLITNNLDGIDGQFLAILSVDNYAPTTATFSSMKSSGNLKLIDDLALQKMLSDYYEGMVVESQKKGEYQVEYFTNELLHWFTMNIDFLEMKLLNTDDLIVLRNKLIIYGSLIEQKVNSYKMNVDSSKKLKTHIESILESK